MLRLSLKLLHYAGLIGFVGGLASTLVLAEFADDAPPTALAALRQSIVALGESVVVPSLVVLLVSGTLLVIARPQLVYARWVWLKAGIALVIAAVALAVVRPAVVRAAAIAAEAALGAPALDALTQAFNAEQVGTIVSLVLAFVAMAVAIWRPRLGQLRRDPGEGER